MENEREADVKDEDCFCLRTLMAAVVKPRWGRPEEGSA